MERKEITIPVFYGEDYNKWKKRITMYLKMKKCDVVITRAKVAADKDDWEESDLKAINLIYCAISNKQLTLWFFSGWKCICNYLKYQPRVHRIFSPTWKRSNLSQFTIYSQKYVGKIDRTYNFIRSIFFKRHTW